MDNNTLQTVQNSKIYNTFSSFINSSQNPRTADKTMEIKTENKPMGKKHSFVSRFFASGALAVGLGILSFRRYNLLKMAHYFETNFNKFQLKKEPKLFDKIQLKFYQAGDVVFSFVKTKTESLSKNMDLYFQKKLSEDSTGVVSNIYKKITNFYQNKEIASVQKRYNKLSSSFEQIEKAVEKQIKIIERSGVANSDIKVSVPEKVLKNGYSDIPRAVDLTLCENGKNRVAELRKYLAETKKLLQELSEGFNKSGDGRVAQRMENLDNVVKTREIKKSLYTHANKISRSIDSNYDRANVLFTDLKRLLCDNNIQDKDVLESIGKIDDSLLKYKFGEVVKDESGVVLFTGAKNKLELRRAYHLNNVQEQIRKLKQKLKFSDPEINKRMNKFEQWISQDISGSEKGCIENIRELLKCNDIKTDFINEADEVSLLKQYSTIDYINLKAKLTQFSRDLQSVSDIETKLSSRFSDLKQGAAIFDTLKIGVPLACIAGTTFTEKNPKERKDKILNGFIPYVAGMSVFVSSYSLNLVKFPIALLSSMITSFVSGQTLNYLDKKINKDA